MVRTQRFLAVFLFVLMTACAVEAAVSDGDFIKLCMGGTSAEVTKALQDGADMDARDEDGYSPLVLAAMYNEDARSWMSW